MRVWRACGEPQSWLAAENAQRIERYISQLRASHAKRRDVQSMALIEQEVTREDAKLYQIHVLRLRSEMLTFFCATGAM